MKHLKFIIAVIIILVVVILLVENLGALSTQVKFKLDLFSIHYKSPEISMGYIIGFSFLFGVVITVLYTSIGIWQLKRQIRNLIKTSKEKDEELNSLRNLPITSDSVGSSNLDNDVE